MPETSYIKFRKKDGIMYCSYADNLKIDLEVAKYIVKSRIEFSDKVSYPVLIDLKGIHSVNKEARDYLAKEGSVLVRAGALLISSPFTRMLGNIFLMINQPKVPSRIFTNEKEAIQWLKQFR